MSVPNLKTFCTAVVQPYLRSFFDYFNPRVTRVETSAAESAQKIVELEKKLDEAMAMLAEVKAGLKSTEEKTE